MILVIGPQNPNFDEAKYQRKIKAWHKREVKEVKLCRQILDKLTKKDIEFIARKTLYKPQGKEKTQLIKELLWELDIMMPTNEDEN